MGMIVGVLTDFEMIFTGEFFKTVWQNSDFVFKVSIRQKQETVCKIGHSPMLLCHRKAAYQSMLKVTVTLTFI